MLDDAKKRDERGLVEMAAIILNEQWHLEACESPDFKVNSPDGSFGLEVTNCFSGTVTKRRGSIAALGARQRQTVLNKIRERCLSQFPGAAHWQLDYINRWQEDSVEGHIISAIRKAIEAKGADVFYVTISEGESYDADQQFPPCIMISKRPSFPRPNAWRNMSDHASPIETLSKAIQKAVDAKREKVALYRTKFENVRLLVCANSLVTRGNLNVEPDFRPEIRGFDKVYFMRFPTYIVEYPSGCVKTLSGGTPESLAWRPE
jgi:hypothetical protein